VPLHQRTRIRQAIVARLLNQTSAGARVFTNRVDPIPTQDLPALRIETNSETSDDIDLAQTSQNRTLQLLVVGLAKATANLDDVLDQLALEAERAIFTAPDPTFGGIVETLNYQGAQIGFAGSLEQPIAEIRLAYSVVYLTLAAHPDLTP